MSILYQNHYTKDNWLFLQIGGSTQVPARVWINARMGFWDLSPTWNWKSTCDHNCCVWRLFQCNSIQFFCSFIYNKPLYFWRLSHYRILQRNSALCTYITLVMGKNHASGKNQFFYFCFWFSAFGFENTCFVLFFFCFDFVCCVE